jgi:hypothetical protein
MLVNLSCLIADQPADLRRPGDTRSLRATEWQSMKWLTEDSRRRAMIVSLFKSKKKFACCPASMRREALGIASKPSMHCCQVSKNRFTAQRSHRGDYLSVRFHIQNSISLTIAMLPRII